MTLTHSDATSLLDAIRADADIDIIRKGVELVLQALIEAEATEIIGAGHYERSESRTNQARSPLAPPPQVPGFSGVSRLGGCACCARIRPWRAGRRGRKAC